MAQWDDLRVRILSALVMLGIGIAALWVGGDVFALLVIFATAIMGWELSRMYAHNPMAPVIFGLSISGTVMCWLFQPWTWAAAGVFICLGIIWLGHRRGQIWMTLQGAVLSIGVANLVWVRLRDEGAQIDYGFALAVLLIAVVIASDVGGYFGGRLFGGRKLWPAVSPKKTWSGTLVGWILAVAIGLIWARFQPDPVILGTLLLCIGAQAGDLLESHIKRVAGIKDSSALIPGHGGLLDRFDGLLGASVVMAVLMWVVP